MSMKKRFYEADSIVPFKNTTSNEECLAYSILVEELAVLIFFYLHMHYPNTLRVY